MHEKRVALVTGANQGVGLQGFTKTNLNGYTGTQSVEDGAREVRTADFYLSTLAPRTLVGVLDEPTRRLPYFARIDELWRAHRSGRADWSFQLWNLYNVSAWHDHWVAGNATA